MKYFIDTEFLESGPGRPITLLSLALVAEDGREYYMATDERMQDEPNEFVKRHVMPEVIRMRQQGRKASLAEIRKQVMEFIGNDGQPEFWGYYSDYDWVVFCQIFGRMVDLPRGFPRFCLDVKQKLFEAGDPEIPQKVRVQGDEIPHCALDDARATKRVFEWVQDLHDKEREQPKKSAKKSAKK